MYGWHLLAPVGTNVWVAPVAPPMYGWHLLPRHLLPRTCCPGASLLDANEAVLKPLYRAQVERKDWLRANGAGMDLWGGAWSPAGDEENKGSREPEHSLTRRLESRGVPFVRGFGGRCAGDFRVPRFSSVVALRFLAQVSGFSRWLPPGLLSFPTPPLRGNCPGGNRPIEFPGWTRPFSGYVRRGAAERGLSSIGARRATTIHILSDVC
jgi:hypothetical protein